MHSAPADRSAAAFSLIELLVSVSVIAVLAGLLLPLVRVAMESARASQCQSHLRQIAAAQLGFAQDHEGYIAPADGGASWSNSALYWNVRLADYTDDDASRQSRTSHVRSIAWGCPAWSQREEYVLKALQADSWSHLYTQRTSGYAMSAAFQGRPATGSQKIENGWWFIDNNRYYDGQPSCDASALALWNARAANSDPLMAQLAVIPWQTRQPLVMDGYMHFFHPWYQGYSSPTNRKLVIERHRGKGAVAFLDGHVALLSADEWAATYWRPDR